MATKKNNKPGHVYIIREREFIKSGESIYKIGRAEDASVRCMGYPKGSELELIIKCHDMLKCENELKRVFAAAFTKMPQIGSEYYSGDIRHMKHVFVEVVYECESIAVGDAPANTFKPVNTFDRVDKIVSQPSTSVCKTILLGTVAGVIVLANYLYSYTAYLLQSAKEYLIEPRQLAESDSDSDSEIPDPYSPPARSLSANNYISKYNSW